MKITSPTSIWKEKIFTKPYVSNIKLLKALANERRLTILAYLLVNRSEHVYGLAVHFSMSEQAMSKHVRILLNVNLVKRYQAGMFAYYRIQRPLPKLARVALSNHSIERLGK